MAKMIGRYELRSELGHGGMAVVYRAFDVSLDREVALKVMAGHLSSDPAFYRRFEREARVVATLEHPNIVPVYDYGLTEEMQPYLVMRLLRGGTLYDRLSSGSMTRPQLMGALGQVASALDYAHGRNIVHRDIKSVNILFDEKGNAYVSDFGIAKVRDATVNLTGNAFMGTPVYMSPEHFKGEEIDGRSDQYSLAVVTFEALSGRAPFTADTAHGLMFQHVSEPPPDIHTLDRSLPPATSAVLRRALAKQPSDRFTTVTAFIQALQQSTTSPGAGYDATADRTRQLQTFYETGLNAYRRGNYPEAADYLGRVIALDANYGNAAQLFNETVMLQTQAARPGAPAPQVVAEAGGPVVAPARARGSRLPLWLGLLALLAIGGVVAFLFLRPGGEPEATPVAVVAPTTAATDTPAPTDTPPPTELPAIAGAARVVEVGSASFRVDGAAAQPVTNGSTLPLEAGKRIDLAVGQGRTQLVLPNNMSLYLNDGAELSLTADRDGTPLATVEQGRVLLWSHADGLNLTSALGAQAMLTGAGVMGVNMLPGALTFEVECFEGSCDVRGTEGGAGLRLRNGQATTIGSDGLVEPPRSADRSGFAWVPEVVGTPEAAVIAEVTEEVTPAPTVEPTTAATATSAAESGNTPTSTRPPASSVSGTGSNTVTLGPGASLDFENFGTWRRGDEANGTLASSTAQVHGGARSAELAYDFATAGNDYVVFFQDHAIEGRPNLLQMWVYGDGSGHYLNAWIEDDAGQTWQVPFGRVTHQGWRQMQGRIEAGQAWPWSHISGPQNDTIEYPISFRGFVFDDRADDFSGQGRIYLDDLTVGTSGASATGATPAPGATSAPGTPTATPTGVASAVGPGAILFTAGDSLLAVDPGGQPRIIGPADSNTCSAAATSGGVTYRLAVPVAGCYPIGHGQVVCNAPDGVSQAFVAPAPAGTSARSILAGTTFIADADLDETEGIIWQPNSRSFLYVVGGEVYQAFTSGGFQRIIGGISGLTCPRWYVGP